MDEINVDLQVSEVFLPLWGLDHEHYALHGGRGGGKSHGIGEALVGHASQRRERVVCGRQFQVSIKDSVKELIEQKIKAMNMAVYYKSTDTEIINVSTGSRFSFLGMDRNPESAKSLEGATIFWGEEAQTFTKRSIELIVPTIRAPGSRMYWSWNPRYRTDEVDMMFRGTVVPEKSYIREVSWRDNAFFRQTRMPSEYRRSLASNPKRHIHIWEGGYDENPESAIFTNYCVDRLDVGDKLLPRFGMDFGFSQDPSALIKAYLFRELKRIYIAAEAFGHKIPNASLPDLMDTIPGARDWNITGDSSRPETIDFLNSEGFNVHSSRKGSGSVKNGINWLQGFELVISPDCPIIGEEIRNYKWKTDPQDKILPLPDGDKCEDHGIDALRYAFEEDSMASLQEAGDGGVAYV